MRGRMQKTSAFANDCPKRDRTESEWYGGVQTFMWKTEDNIVEVPFDREYLLEVILSPENLNKAYKAVLRNKGCGGIDKMSCEQLLPWLLANKDELTRSLLDGTYRPNPVRRVEISKDNGKMRLLGIPTVLCNATSRGKTMAGMKRRSGRRHLTAVLWTAMTLPIICSSASTA